METAGKTRTLPRGRLISIAIVALAVALALYALHESNTYPTSSDSSIDADVVHVAAAVGGRIIPVSYTHLDVYKRQLFVWSAAAAAFDRAIPRSAAACSRARR